MPLTKMEHFLVLTADIDRTRDFYRDVLGMNEGFRPDLGFPGHWLYIGDTPCIHIAEWHTYTAHSAQRDIPVSAHGVVTGPVDHIAFTATDFEGVVARLRQNGVQPARNITHDNGFRQLFVFDPNGVKIEINFPPWIQGIESPSPVPGRALS